MSAVVGSDSAKLIVMCHKFLLLLLIKSVPKIIISTPKKVVSYNQQPPFAELFVALFLLPQQLIIHYSNKFVFSTNKHTASLLNNAA